MVDAIRNSGGDHAERRARWQCSRIAVVREYIDATGAFRIAPALYGPVTTTVEQQMKIPTSLQVDLLDVWVCFRLRWFNRISISLGC